MINEQAVDVEAGTFRITPYKKKNDIIQLNFSWIRNMVEISGINVFYGYGVDCEPENRTQKTTFLKAIKQGKGVSENDLNNLVIKALEGFNMNHKLSKFDVMVYPKSSGTINKLIADKIKAKSPNTIVVHDAFIKEQMTNIKLDVDKIHRFIDDINEESRMVETLLKVIQDSEKTSGEIKLKRFSKEQRQFITNFIKLDKPISERIFKLMVSGEVLILDDILTSGQSLSEMIKQLTNLGVVNMSGFTLFKV